MKVIVKSSEEQSWFGVYILYRVHRFAGLIHGRSLLSRILGLLLVWEGVILELLISLPKEGWKINNRRSTAC